MTPIQEAALRKALVDFRQSRTIDTVVLYQAGHAIALPQGKDTYCYLTEEAPSKEGVIIDSAVRKQVSVSSNELAEWMKRIPALKRVVVLDTCAAGSAGGVFREKRGVPGDQLRAVTLLQERVGVKILMGCAADAVSYEATRFGQGLVTYAVLDGVRGAALQNKEYVDVDTLFRYVSEAVPKLALGLGGIQKPEFLAEGGAFAVGRMLSEHKAKVPLGAERPVVLRPSFQGQDTGDPLRLAARVRERVIEREAAGARGEGAGLMVAYVDVDEMPRGLRPTARYTVEGGTVHVHLAVWRDGKALRTEDIEGTTGRLDDLVDRVFKTIIAAWTPTPPSPKASAKATEHERSQAGSGG